jgi:hypothetical protein
MVTLNLDFVLLEGATTDKAAQNNCASAVCVASGRARSSLAPPAPFQVVVEQAPARDWDRAKEIPESTASPVRPGWSTSEQTNHEISSWSDKSNRQEVGQHDRRTHRSTGFIGSHVLAKLLDNGPEVTALLRDEVQADAVVTKGANADVVPLILRDCGPIQS